MSTSGADHGIGHPDGFRSTRPRSSVAAMPKSESTGLPVGGEQDVRGLDVAVQHPGPVRGLDRATDLHRDAQHLGHRDAFAAGSARSSAGEHSSMTRYGRPSADTLAW